MTRARLQSHPFVRGAPYPLLLTPQTTRCECLCHKNVRGWTDALRRCTVSSPCFPCNHALKATHFSCGRGLRGPSNFFRDFWLQVRFVGVGGRSRTPKNVRSSSLNRASSTVHVMLCSWVWILGVPIFKMDEYLTFEYSLQESTRLSH